MPRFSGQPVLPASTDHRSRIAHPVALHGPAWSHNPYAAPAPLIPALPSCCIASWQQNPAKRILRRFIEFVTRANPSLPNQTPSSCRVFLCKITRQTPLESDFLIWSFPPR